MKIEAKMALSEMMSIDSLHDDPIIKAIVQSQANAPYMQIAEAQLMKNQDLLNQALATIRSLPFKSRYVYRVASLLKLSLGDMETQSAYADLEGMSEVEKLAVRQELGLRVGQLAHFVTAMLGAAEAERHFRTALDIVRDKRYSVDGNQRISLEMPAIQIYDPNARVSGASRPTLKPTPRTIDAVFTTKAEPETPKLFSGALVNPKKAG